MKINEKCLPCLINQVIKVANITNCYNEGSIAGTETGIGGILGWASGPNTSGNIEKNYNKGAISGKDKERI